MSSLCSQLASALPRFALVPASEQKFLTLIWESPVGLSSCVWWQQPDLQLSCSLKWKR